MMHVHQAVRYPTLWRRLVVQQARFVRRMLKRRPPHLRKEVTFGDLQHPDLEPMMGRTGPPDFMAARDRWVQEVRREIFYPNRPSLLEIIARAAS